MTRNAKSNERPSIVLKTIHDAIMRDNPNSTLTTKQMRARLRVELRDEHIRNTSWTFTQSRADDIRAMFDDTFRAKRERAMKRASRPTTTRKRNARTNDDANATNETHDANA